MNFTAPSGPKAPDNSQRTFQPDYALACRHLAQPKVSTSVSAADVTGALVLAIIIGAACAFI